MKKNIKTVVFINNTVAPYRIPLFNNIKHILHRDGIEMEAVFLCEKESVREWTINYNEFEFNYSILPVLFQKRDLNTTTSDMIINSGFFRYLFTDVVVLFGYNYPTYLILLICRKILLKRTILFSESTTSDKTRGKGLLHLIKSVLIGKLFTSYITPGVEAKEFLKTYGAKSDNIHIAENAVLPFGNVNVKIINDDSITLLYVGRLASEKNIDFIIKSVPDNGKYKLIIVGTGPEEENLKSISVNYNIEFRGFEEGTILAETFAESDILILASESEPWGLVVNEAVNMGLAILVSNTVGCRNELVNGNGAIFNLGDKKDFVNKLQSISENLGSCKSKSLEIAKNITIQNQANKISKVILNV